jgi:hypothetical protein
VRPEYTSTRLWLALRHQLPWPLMSSLADAHRRGVVRQVCAVYQFRHIELQHRLANEMQTSGKRIHHLQPPPRQMNSGTPVGVPRPFESAGIPAKGLSQGTARSRGYVSSCSR